MELICKDVVIQETSRINEETDGLFNKWSLGLGNHFIVLLSIIIKIKFQEFSDS